MAPNGFGTRLPRAGLLFRHPAQARLLGIELHLWKPGEKLLRRYGVDCYQRLTFKWAARLAYQIDLSSGPRISERALDQLSESP